MSDEYIRKVNLVKRTIPCPKCGTDIKRHRLGHTTFEDLNGRQNKPIKVEVIYGVHYCEKCDKFKAQPIAISSNNSGHGKFTLRVRNKAVKMVDDGNSLTDTIRKIHRKYGISIPLSTLHDWVNDPRN